MNKIFFIAFVAFSGAAYSETSAKTALERFVGACNKVAEGKV